MVFKIIQLIRSFLDVNSSNSSTDSVPKERKRKKEERKGRREGRRELLSITTKALHYGRPATLGFWAFTTLPLAYFIPDTCLLAVLRVRHDAKAALLHFCLEGSSCRGAQGSLPSLLQVLCEAFTIRSPMTMIFQVTNCFLSTSDTPSSPL